MALVESPHRALDAPLLNVERLAVRFGPVRAIDGVDLRIHDGELVALAGENGAGKSTLVRCIAGDMAPSSGRIHVDGQPLGTSPAAAGRRGVAVVWQNLALCENLDVASNLLLGREGRSLLRSPTRFHAAAARRLTELGIPLSDTTRTVSTLSGGQRQLLAVARAMVGRPRLLVLDEPTASLGVVETAQVERLMLGVRSRSTTVLLVSHDIDQMFRLADRIFVMRHGRMVAEVEPSESHPDEVIALITGQQSDSSARRQLSRLHGLTDRLASAEPSSSLPLILSALAGALGAEQLCIHLLDDATLYEACELGLPQGLKHAWEELPVGPDGGPPGLAASAEDTVVDPDVQSSPAWERWREMTRQCDIGSSWSVPVIASAGPAGVITVFRRAVGHPSRDELELVKLYAGYAASAVERERLLSELTARNRVLETIQEVLETLAGPVPLSEGIVVVLAALCEGLQAQAVALVVAGDPAGTPEVAVVDARGAQHPASEALLDAAARVLNAGRRDDGRARITRCQQGEAYLAVTFPAPSGASALLAHWPAASVPGEAIALLEDAANSLRLAHERQESERARQEASALRRTQELQRGFLRRLSHELRTPLTAIRGYASSLMQTDVTWDGESQERFLSRIANESARLGRLVDDLLDFSAIESATLRLAPDWCDLALVLDAALACLPPANAGRVEVDFASELPVIWADHDRLEQVFVNLLENAFRHNGEATEVLVHASADGGASVVITVTDDGEGGGEPLAAALEGVKGRRSATAGAGLGLSIARGIVEAHEGTISLEPLGRGARFSIRLPVERAGGVDAGAPALEPAKASVDV